MLGQKDKTIKVTVDKSHLLTLGERMYLESIELIRELVNNAYDADAAEVYITIGHESIKVEDNGSGMNEKGLAQFFTIGLEEKLQCSISPRFGRKRIGQFGIGKFAALTVADQFMVESRKGDWLYRVIFNREDWQKSAAWELPIIKEKASPLDQEGTKVILTKLKKQFSSQEVEKYIKESIPLRAKKFNVFLNGKRITPHWIAGRIISLNIKTLYGPIEGEIIIALNPREVEKPGLECRVKQVLVKRDFFDLDQKYRLWLNRICGSVNADFLPIISARTDFIKDSPEYKLFYQLVRSELEKVLKEIKKQSEIKHFKKIAHELREALDKIRKSLLLNPELAPAGYAVTRRQKRQKETLLASALLQPKGKIAPAQEVGEQEKEPQKKPKEQKKQQK